LFVFATMWLCVIPLSDLAAQASIRGVLANVATEASGDGKTEADVDLQDDFALDTGTAITFDILHEFTWTGGPYGQLARDPAGNLYGATNGSALNPTGAVYKLTRHPGGRWTIAILHVFAGGSDGEVPQGGVTRDADGNLYGTTALGGSGGGGIVYKLTRTLNGWQETVLHSFVGNGPDGAYPTESLTFDEKGNLYGTTWRGGSKECGCGVVYRLSRTPDGTWSETVLHRFSGPDGAGPEGVSFNSSGDIYGAAGGGDPNAQCGPGAGRCGVVFRFTHDSEGNWVYSVVHRFNYADGWDPTAAVIFDAAGNLYSTTAVGGPFNAGVVFKLAKSSDGTWVETVLHAFDNGAGGGGLAGGVTFGPDGNLYGGAAVGGIGGGGVGDGIIYKLTHTASGWRESVLHTFSGFKQGSFPRSPLLIDPAGHIYGTAMYGLGDNGLVFEIKQ
jgi:uncharacterized repeat protein (TIGR03803 family)